ncbi:MAG: phosphatidylserine decarboxylase family protein [Syntrophobacteraceae bacterium]
MPILRSSDFRHKSNHIPVASEGIPYIAAAAFTTLIFAVLGYSFLALPILIFTLFICHFFRDPERINSAAPSDILSPADGKIIAVKEVERTLFIDKPCRKISIFMSVFDVHVNRIPNSGTLRGLSYKKGRFLAANHDRAGVENEQNWLWIQADSGHDIVLTQVAGLIAQRIVCRPAVGEKVLQGERFGMIRFGSRMDVYVPIDSEILVSKGEHVYSGETVLCRLK